MYVTLEIDEKKFVRLVKLVHLGNHIVNGNREGTREDPKIEKYEELEELILKFAFDNGHQDLVCFDYDSGRHVPTEDIEHEEEMIGFIREYDECVLWDELGNLLAERDTIEEIGNEASFLITQKEKENIRAEYKDKYFREFEESGVKNLRIVLPSESPAPEESGGPYETYRD